MNARFLRWWTLCLKLLRIVVVLVAMQNFAYAEDTAADARVISENITYKISGNSAKLTVYRKIEVYNADGKDYGYFRLSEDKFQRVKYFSGTVYDANERIIFVREKDDAEPVCGYSEYSLYDDVCHRNFALVSDRYPFTLEYEYEVEHKSLYFWPDWRPQKSIPVVESQYTLIAPSDLEFRVETRGGDIQPMVSSDGDKSTYTWELIDLPAVKRQKYASPDSEPRTRVEFSPQDFEFGGCRFDASSWIDLGTGYSCLIKDCFELNDEQRAHCDTIAATCTSDIEKCNALHESLSSRLRYVSIEIGVGGWKPSKSKDSFRRGYGDCKDLSTVYVSMLREMGIAANLALIRTRTAGETSPDFPTMGRFNHAILYAIIANDTIWTDPTCQYCKFGDLPWFDENTYALGITENGGRLIPTPGSMPSENLVLRKARISLNDAGSISAEVDVTLRGNVYHFGRAYLDEVSRENLERLVKSDLVGVSASYQIDSVECIDPGTSGEEISVRAFGTSRNAVFTSVDHTYIDLTFLAPLRKREKTSLSDRSQAIELLFALGYSDTITILTPDGWGLSETPDDAEIENEFGYASARLQANKDHLLMVREKRLNCHAVQPEQFGRFEECRANFEKACMDVLVLTAP